MRFIFLLIALAGFNSAFDSSLQFDVVFLIDGSRTANENFATFTNFITNLMNSYNVSQTGARVGLVVVGPDAYDQAPPAALLNTIGSAQQLKSYLALLDPNYVAFDKSGQLLTFNLQVVTSKSFLSSGYRAGLNNHLLIYITSTTSFYTDPIPTAAAIIEQAEYGIVTIGYGPDVSNEKLKAISGGSPCSFSALNDEELNSHIKSIRRLIMYADANSGAYCGMRKPVTQAPVTQLPKTTMPPQTVPTVTPSNALKFDIVFLIDGSKSAQNSFDQFTKFIQTMMVSFAVGLDYARVGLVVVAPCCWISRCCWKK